MIAPCLGILALLVEFFAFPHIYFTPPSLNENLIVVPVAEVSIFALLLVGLLWRYGDAG